MVANDAQTGVTISKNQFTKSDSVVWPEDLQRNREIETRHNLGRGCCTFPDLLGCGRSSQGIRFQIVYFGIGIGIFRSATNYRRTGFPLCCHGHSHLSDGVDFCLVTGSLACRILGSSHQQRCLGPCSWASDLRDQSEGPTQGLGVGNRVARMTSSRPFWLTQSERAAPFMVLVLMFPRHENAAS